MRGFHFLRRLTEKQETIGQDDRLQRPWTILIFGTLVLLVIVCTAYTQASQSRLMSMSIMVWIAAFAALSFVLNVLYAYLGWRYSRTLARRVLGKLGGAMALIGVAVLVYAIEKLAP